ncbi:hypothetical protein N7G274_009041 [Stereocaulon virgatum]|uniref:Uncharacterized protein n=1 Tax=Stereocaulon virgatum TaxID=373712 RepID=A0ABR3ZY04_9LECA
MDTHQPQTPNPTSISNPPNPSRFLTDLLRPPHVPNASYLLTLSQASLKELHYTQVKIVQMHAEARKKFVIARAWFDGVSAEGGGGGEDGGKGLQGEGDVGEVGKGKVGEAERVYERALRELEMRRLEVLRVERDVAVLKGDVAFLTNLVMRKRQQQQQH